MQPEGALRSPVPLEKNGNFPPALSGHVFDSCIALLEAGLYPKHNCRQHSSKLKVQVPAEFLAEIRSKLRVSIFGFLAFGPRLVLVAIVFENVETWFDSPPHEVKPVRRTPGVPILAEVCHTKCVLRHCLALMKVIRRII